MVILGAFISGYENFNRDWFGYILVWMTNLSGSIYSVYVNKFNKDNRVTAFELNLFYAWIGLPIFLAATCYVGEIELLWHGFTF